MKIAAENQSVSEHLDCLREGEGGGGMLLPSS